MIPASCVSQEQQDAGHLDDFSGGLQCGKDFRAIQEVHDKQFQSASQCQCN